MYTVHCDGSCLGNPGPGGFGIIILKDDEIVAELSAGETHTTNNIMELTAVISAIAYIRSEYNYDGNISVFTDSKYVVNGMNEWRIGWKKRNWKGVKNLELWMLLDSIGNECTYTHEYGHAGNVYNEMADTLAKAAAKEMQ